MEIAGLKVAMRQLRDATAVAYSLVVAATTIPGFAHISSGIVIPYYVFIPGYFITLLLGYRGTILERLFFTVAWSLATVAAVYSITTLAPGDAYIPISVITPALTIIILAYDHLHGK